MPIRLNSAQMVILWCCLAVLGVMALAAGPRGLRPVLVRVAVTGAMLLVTLVLLKVQMPARLGLALSLGSFEELLRADERDRGWRRPPDEVAARAGLYRVVAREQDPRGGTYFCTYEGWDGLGPDVMSYGFAHQPNPEGSPFGAEHYHTVRLLGDWHLFLASNDWH